MSSKSLKRAVSLFDFKLLRRFVNPCNVKLLRRNVNLSIIKTQGVIVKPYSSKLPFNIVSHSANKLLEIFVRSHKLAICLERSANLIAFKLQNRDVSLRMLKLLEEIASRLLIKLLRRNVSPRMLKPLGEIVEVIKWIN
jgi:hypothetical protein